MNRAQITKILFILMLPFALLLACRPLANENQKQAAEVTETRQVTTSVLPPTATKEPSPTPSPPQADDPAEVVIVVEDVEPADEPIETPTSPPTETPQPTATPTEEPGIVRSYNIDQERSEVRFYIDEVLFGKPKTVVGRTNLISGQITVDLKRPAEAQVGPIQIDARTLATDDSFRNRAIRNTILDSSLDEYQFITFTPTAVEGLGQVPVEIGQPVTFDLAGDLSIRDITNAVTFVVTATADLENQLSGFGVVTVLRSEYDLRIPSVTGVAQVSEEVRLEIDFVAMTES